MSTPILINRESLEAIADKIREEAELTSSTKLGVPNGFIQHITSCKTAGKDHMLRKAYSTYNSIPESKMHRGDAYGPYAFAGNENLTEATLNGDCTVSSYCFLNCSNLESVNWEEGTSGRLSGVGCFEGCTSLETIRLVGGSALLNSGIVPRAFYGCTSLSDVSFSTQNENDSVGYEAFFGCSSLSSHTFSLYINNIGYSAFEGSGITSIYINPMYTNFSLSIGNRAFANCTDLETATIICDRTTTLGQYCFAGDTSLTSITLPEGLTSIPAHCFDGCTSLTSITIPASVLTIDDYAFNNCTSLASVTFSGNSSLRTIGSRAFFNNNSLVNFVVPAGVTSIGSYAFAYSGNEPTAMRYLRLLPTTPPTAGSYILDKTILNDSFVIYVPRSIGDTVLDAYKNATNWKNANYRTRIQEWVES